MLMSNGSFAIQLNEITMKKNLNGWQIVHTLTDTKMVHVRRYVHPFNSIQSLIKSEKNLYIKSKKAALNVSV